MALGIGTGRQPVQNIPQTLRALKKVDPELRKRVPNEIKSYAQPMLAEVKAGMPARMLSGWGRRGRTGYRASSARYKTTLQFKGTPPRSGTFETASGRRFTVKRGDAWPILRVRSKHLALIIASTANKSRTDQGAAMVRKLREEHGPPDRFIWPHVERNMNSIERGIRSSLRRYEKIVNRELERRN
jgi:hypothetical protein